MGPLLHGPGRGGLPPLRPAARLGPDLLVAPVHAGPPVDRVAQELPHGGHVPAPAPGTREAVLVEADHDALVPGPAVVGHEDPPHDHGPGGLDDQGHAQDPPPGPVRPPMGIGHLVAPVPVRGLAAGREPLQRGLDLAPPHVLRQPDAVELVDDLDQALGEDARG